MKISGPKCGVSSYIQDASSAIGHDVRRVPIASAAIIFAAVSLPTNLAHSSQPRQITFEDPVRGQVLDVSGGYDYFRGPGGTRFAFQFSWFETEAGDAGSKGWSIDDPYFEWSEQHPTDQPANSINDCNAIGGKCTANVCTIGNVGAACTTDAQCVRRAGSNVNARQCGTVAFERMYLHACT